MNHIINNNYARLSSKLATFFAIILTLIFAGCEKPEKVVKEINRGFYYMKSTEFYVITEIRRDGTVEVGYTWSYISRGDELCAYPGFKLKLEGPAKAGDSFRYRIYFKEVLMESGEVRKVIEKITVESDKQKEYDMQMSETSTVEDKPPGTK